MLSQRLLKSAIFLTLLITLTSCYTRFGVVRVEPVEEVYGYEGEPAHEEIYENDVVVTRHVYVNRYYHPGHFYFDPYDAWYFEPGIHFSFGYYYGPGYYTPVHYVPPYYASPVYACIPPIYYPPYWHPGHYPVYYPVYHPGPYYGGHSGPRYGGSTTPMKRRNFGRRSNTAIASNTSLKRRGSGSDGNTQIGRRSYSTGDGAPGRRFIRRDSSSKRKDNTPDPKNKTYKRQVVRKRSDNSGSGDNTYFSGRNNKRSDTKRSYGTRGSSGSKSGPGYSTKVSSGSSRSKPSVSRKRSSSGNRSSNSTRVTRSGSGSRNSSVTRSRSTGSRSSSPSRVTRSSSGSRSSSPSRSASSGSSRSSGSSKSSSRGSSKPSRR